ncbi:hypothetical protein [Saccharothrix longispora]|uniref:hypothetical protein n=1 Tax=Saccharothrix longispora TaxID=33920 RepID=UPI0028FD83FF|nr:hypothetical protein [Saccharothrix longispora]MDU0294311.1 hypothetical protein [Saccharothrix longispora]
MTRAVARHGRCRRRGRGGRGAFGSAKPVGAGAADAATAGGRGADAADVVSGVVARRCGAHGSALRARRVAASVRGR